MRFNTKSTAHVIDILFTLALFCVFAGAALMVVLIGANVYKKTVSTMDANFSMRTSVTYVSAKIRQNDTYAAVYLDELDGLPALVMEQDVDGQIYETWIYHYDGSLRELFVRKGNAAEAAHGMAIVEIDYFEVNQLADGLLELVSWSADGSNERLLVSPRCAMVSAGSSTDF